MTPDDQPFRPPFRFEDWLTLKDAASSLSAAFSEDFGEPDVLRLALDGRLTLSVDFVNRTYANLGRVRPATDFQVVSTDDGEPVPRRVVLWRGGESTYGALISERDVVQLDADVAVLQGLWDLPLIGCERLDVQHEYQRLTGGPAIRAAGGPHLTLVHRTDGLWAQLLMHMDGATPSDRWDPIALSLRRPFLDVASMNEFEEAEILGEIPTGSWSLAPGLPADSVFVVRTAALTQIIASGRPGSERRRPVAFSPSGVNGVRMGANTARMSGEGSDNAPSYWKELTIRFLSDERIQLHIRDQPGETLNYAELGFEDRRSGKQSQVWSTLLQLADKRGVVTLADLSRPGDRPRIEKHVQHIRKVLRNRFPNVDGDPLPWQGDRYQAQFIIMKARASDA